MDGLHIQKFIQPISVEVKFPTSIYFLTINPSKANVPLQASSFITRLYYLTSLLAFAPSFWLFLIFNFFFFIVYLFFHLGQVYISRFDLLEWQVNLKLAHSLLSDLEVMFLRVIRLKSRSRCFMQIIPNPFETFFHKIQGYLQDISWIPACEILIII